MALAAAALGVAAPRPARAEGPVIRCGPLIDRTVVVDGLLDDWTRAPANRAGDSADARVELRCSWNPEYLALLVLVDDERVVRVRGKGDDDRVTLRLSAGGAPLVIDARPGNAIAPAKLSRPAAVEVADSLQPEGFSVEVRVPASAIPGLGPSTPTIDLSLVFHDSDRATGGDARDVRVAGAIELPDRVDLLAMLLRATRLDRRQITLDAQADVDPGRPGKERVVAGGAVIAVLTDQFAFVTLPVAHATDVLGVKLLPLGAGGLQVVAATVRQAGNGGSRDLLLLWTVAGGQLQPLGQIEVRKAAEDRVLEAAWGVRPAPRGKGAPELVVTPRPAVGWTADSFVEAPAPDADPIPLPWDATRGGVAYALREGALVRRDLPAPTPRR